MPPLHQMTGTPWSNYMLIDYDEIGAAAFAADVDYGRTDHWAIAFLSPSMALVSSTAPYGDGQSNDRILARSDADFVVPISNLPYERETYAPDGGLATQSANNGLVRIDGNDTVYWLKGPPWQLQRNPFPL